MTCGSAQPGPGLPHQIFEIGSLLEGCEPGEGEPSRPGPLPDGFFHVGQGRIFLSQKGIDERELARHGAVVRRMPQGLLLRGHGLPALAEGRQRLCFDGEELGRR